MSQSPAEQRSQRKNLQLLVLIRSLSIAMQCIAIAIAVAGFGIELSLLAVATVIVAEVVVNGATAIRLRRLTSADLGLARYELLAQLLVDVAALSLLLYLTGGGLNPFTGLFIVPVILAATLLNQGQTWLLLMVSIACYCGLALMPSEHAHHMSGATSLFDAHRYGMLLGFIVSAVLITVFVSRIAANLAERDAQLFKINQQAEASRQINALGMLAAGAAHELGTPLNSLALIASELRSSLGPNADTDVLLDMHSKQLERAKRSLHDLMSATGESRAENAQSVHLADFFAGVAARWHKANSHITLQLDNKLPPHLRAASDRLFEKAVVNLLDNAAKVSPHWVQLSLWADTDNVYITVSDHGSGISDAVIESLHEPAGLALQQFGFGLFWVNAFAIRMQGSLRFNRPTTGGTEAQLRLPL